MKMSDFLKKKKQKSRCCLFCKDTENLLDFENPAGGIFFLCHKCFRTKSVLATLGDKIL